MERIVARSIGSVQVDKMPAVLWAKKTPGKGGKTRGIANKRSFYCWKKERYQKGGLVLTEGEPVS